LSFGTIYRYTIRRSSCCPYGAVYGWCYRRSHKRSYRRSHKRSYRRTNLISTSIERFENENVRRESKLSVPDRNIEPAISTTPGIPDISIRHEPEIKGGLKALQQKGLKITDYKENIPRPRKR
jgi:hypothetical protein